MKTFQKLKLLLLAVFLFQVPGAFCQSGIRSIVDFGKDWRFHLGDVTNAQTPDFKDDSWRKLNVPHDWSVEGEFNEKNPATTGGGALPGGIGWYRKSFTVGANLKGKYLFIDFDGVYCNSEVWINGKYLGKRPYGYSSFRYDLTPYLIYGAKNTIAVKVDNSQQPNSRWYSGSGIYRNVWLVTTNRVMVDHWGTYVTTPVVNESFAKAQLRVQVKNGMPQKQTVLVNNSIVDAAGKPVSTSSSKKEIPANGVEEIEQTLSILQPKLWTIENPYLYKCITQIEVNGKVSDVYTTPLGIRYFEFDQQKGFLLNGKHVKILGVCNHHDLGCLGSAINVRGLERQLEILKEMGCNGIRTSHNPPAPELLDLADKMGFIVMDEAFDMWKKEKNPYDYHLYWDEWHKRDLEDMVKRDRNHPSVFIWSIGNEIPEQWDSTGVFIAKELASIVRTLDNTRPLTSACNNPVPKNSIIKSGAIDLTGYNYHHQNYENFFTDFPGQKFIASETTSAIATRGSYDMPSDSMRIWPTRWDKPFDQGNADLSCSAYDNCHVPWGSSHEETWKVMKKHDYLSGMFIWTGFDYLGEPTPYPWPARSSYFGIVDLAGFPKDAYYMYQSEWTTKPVLHVFPHWNWKPGQLVDVWVYSNAQEVELFLNGKSLGTKSKVGDELHLMWRIPFEAGTIKAVSRTNGKVVITKELKTAGAPAKIVLSADRSSIKADGRDLSYIKVSVTDKDGNLVPNADNLVNFKLTGDGAIVGVDNGSPISMESFKDNKRKAFHGLCLAVLQSAEKAGKLVLTATSEGLEPASVTITTK